MVTEDLMFAVEDNRDYTNFDEMLSAYLNGEVSLDDLADSFVIVAESNIDEAIEMYGECPIVREINEKYCFKAWLDYYGHTREEDKDKIFPCAFENKIIMDVESELGCT